MADHLSTLDQQIHLEIPIESPPERIVSLVPGMTESLFELNLGSRVVGRTEDCVLPMGKVERVTVVGSMTSVDVDLIQELAPDLIIMNQEQNLIEDVENLQATGIPIWLTYPKTIADVFNMLWNVMYVCEETSMVPRVRLMEQTYDWVSAVTETNEDQICRVFAAIDANHMKTFNSDTYMDHVLTTCGATNIFANHTERYFAVDWNQVQAVQPDVILLAEGGKNGFSAEDVIEVGNLDIPAAHTGNIHLIDHRLLSWPGIRLAFALETIPPLICAEHSEMDEK